VTNRELPELLRFGGASDFNVSGGPVRAVNVLRAPTRPQPPMGLADGAWRVISHLTPNYASLAPTDHDDPSILRDHLALYGRIEDAMTRRQVDGVLTVHSTPVTRRVPGHDRLAFARGLRIRLKLDDVSYENARMFLFSAVLERFLAEFATINSFTECVFESVQEGTFVQWPPRVGRRRNI
jgi:type VI secretion system protein ImpG